MTTLKRQCTPPDSKEEEEEEALPRLVFTVVVSLNPIYYYILR
jgi:hypothetical protein